MSRRSPGVTLLNIGGGPAKDYIVDEVGSGAAWFDYDNDGDLDVLIVNGSTRERVKQGGDPLAALYRNDGNGPLHRRDRRAADWRAAAGGWAPASPTTTTTASTMCTSRRVLGPNVLYRNNGNGTFTDVTRQAGVGDTRWSTGCAFGDYDRDGNVDLYVANYVAFDERTIPKRGADAGCTLHDRGRVVRSERTDRRTGRPVPQQRTRRLHRRHARGRHQGPGILRIRRALHRSGQRRLARYLRRERFDAELPVSQQPQRHVYRRPASWPAWR